MGLNLEDLTKHPRQPEGPESRYNHNECGDTRGRLYLNVEKKKWVCFNCGEGGRIRQKDLPDFSRAEVSDPGRSIRISLSSRIYGTGVDYLKEHNIDPDVAHDFGVRSGTNAVAGRLVFPAAYNTMAGRRIVYRTAHATEPGVRPKTLAQGNRRPMCCVRGPAGEVVLPWEGGEVRFEGVRCAVLVEGPADALRLATYCTENGLTQYAAVCLFGKTLNDENAELLGGLFENFYVMLDRQKNLGRGSEAPTTIDVMDILDVFADGGVVGHLWWNRGPWDPAECSDRYLEMNVYDRIRRTFRRGK
jgi:hypothetical protein